MKNLQRKKLLSGFLTCFLIGVTASHDLRAGEKCSPILRAAEVARHDFSLKLKSFPAETEYDRFVENIDNYDIGLSGSGDVFVVVFKLRARRGTIAGGGGTYKIRKKDLAIINFVGQE